MRFSVVILLFANFSVFAFFVQFWGAEKDTSRLESAIFEDLNRYCWTQQNSSSDISSQPCNTDGQIYTLTVLNGNEPWLQQQHQQEPNLIQRKICDTPEDTPTPALDFDSLLNTFPGYIKTEYTYDDSGFSTDNKDDIILQAPLPSLQPPQQQQQQNQHPSIQQQISVTNSTNLNNINAAFHNNNNNDWQMADHNLTTVDDGNVSVEWFSATQTTRDLTTATFVPFFHFVQETPESLLRSALQGKGYTKGMQNCIAVIPSINTIKSDDDLRRALFTNDAQVSDEPSSHSIVAN